MKMGLQMPFSSKKENSLKRKNHEKYKSSAQYKQLILFTT